MPFLHYPSVILTLSKFIKEVGTESRGEGREQWTVVSATPKHPPQGTFPPKATAPQAVLKQRIATDWTKDEHLTQGQPIHWLVSDL